MRIGMRSQVDKPADFKTPRERAEELYLNIHKMEKNDQRWHAMRRLAREDLYYLLTVVLGRVDARRDGPC